MDYDEISDQTAGISTAGELETWFKQAGYKKIFDNTGYFSHSDKNDINKLNQYAHQGYKVVSLISGALLRNGGETWIPVKSHWIVWMSPFEIAANGNVSLNLFSWGNVGNQIKPQKNIKDFMCHTFGGMVFKSLK